MNQKSELSDIEAKFVTALNAPDYAAFRKYKVDDPAPGTFQWFLRHEKVLPWLSGDESTLLWIRGSPGQGKTVLSKFLLDHLESSPFNLQQNAKVIYFFCYNQ